MSKIKKKRLWSVYTALSYNDADNRGSTITVVASNMREAIDRALAVDRKYGWKRCYPIRAEMIDEAVY